MGMYDEIYCDYPLPGVQPACKFDEYQTKDLDCELEQYHITEAGELTKNGVVLRGHTLSISFYGGNAVGGHGPINYTRNGEDAESAEYTATFHAGVLQSIVQDSYSREPAWPASKGRPAPAPWTDEDRAAWKALTGKSRVGGTLYRWWGGQPDGYEVRIVAENDKEFVGVKPDGNFETIDRRDFGRILYESEAEAKAERQAEADKWAAMLAEWNAFVAEWNERRAAAALRLAEPMEGTTP